MNRLFNLRSVTRTARAHQLQAGLSALPANRFRLFTRATLLLMLFAFSFLPVAQAQDTNSGKSYAALTSGAVLLDEATGAPLFPAGLSTNTYSSADGKALYLQVRNPDRERLTIRLVNQKGKVCYDQRINVKEHAYRFVMEGMEAGTYQVQVIGQSKKITRDIAYNYQPSTYQVTMQPANIENPIAIRSKKP